jgi:hypothetical protein
MKSLHPRLAPLLAASLLTLAAAALAGCSTSTKISGDYQTPNGNVSGTVGFSTNGVDLSGSYAATNQTVSGSIDLNK